MCLRDLYDLQNHFGTQPSMSSTSGFEFLLYETKVKPEAATAEETAR